MYARQKITQLEAEIYSLNKNTKRFNDLESVKKAFIAGYGSRHYDPKGWENNVVCGYVEKTHGSATYRPDEYVTLVINTKLITIRLEYIQTRVEECIRYIFVNDVLTDSIEDMVGHFERDLLYTMLSEMPVSIYWFENAQIQEKFRRNSYIDGGETDDEEMYIGELI